MNELSDFMREVLLLLAGAEAELSDMDIAKATGRRMNSFWGELAGLRLESLIHTRRVWTPPTPEILGHDVHWLTARGWYVVCQFPEFEGESRD